MTQSTYASSSKAPSQSRGFTLIELMVAVVIALALTLALTKVMISFERGKQVLNNNNDLSLTGAFVSYELDRDLRSAGSGFAQTPAAMGCLLQVSRNNQLILPAGQAFPAPFNAVPTQRRLLPVFIHAGAGAGGSDVIAIATGASGVGESSIAGMLSSATVSGMRVRNTLGVRANDLILVADTTLGCILQQVTTPFTGGVDQQLDFAGTYAAPTINGVALSGYTVNEAPSLLDLGNIVGNTPKLTLLGIGANATLFSYDMLQLNGQNTAPVPLANGVVDMRARYGVDTNLDGVIDSWVAANDASVTEAALRTCATNPLSILAVKVAVIVRGDGADVSASPLTMFASRPPAEQVQRVLTADEQKMRLRAIEFTVPLRNVMLSYRAALPSTTCIARP